MKKILLIILLFITTACHRKAVCPAYTGIDPVWNGINESKEKFVNSDDKASNKENVKEKVEKELKSKTKKRKRPHNLFPSYMR